MRPPAWSASLRGGGTDWRARQRPAMAPAFSQASAARSRTLPSRATSRGPRAAGCGTLRELVGVEPRHAVEVLHAFERVHDVGRLGGVAQGVQVTKAMQHQGGEPIRSPVRIGRVAPESGVEPSRGYHRDVGQLARQRQSVGQGGGGEVDFGHDQGGTAGHVRSSRRVRSQGSRAAHTRPAPASDAPPRRPSSASASAVPARGSVDRRDGAGDDERRTAPNRGPRPPSS